MGKHEKKLNERGRKRYFERRRMLDKLVGREKFRVSNAILSKEMRKRAEKPGIVRDSSGVRFRTSRGSRSRDFIGHVPVE